MGACNERIIHITVHSGCLFLVVSRVITGVITGGNDS